MQSSVNVNEGDTFQLCVLVNGNAAECGVAYDFDVSLTVSASSPGTYTSVSHTFPHIIDERERPTGLNFSLFIYGRCNVLRISTSFEIVQHMCNFSTGAVTYRNVYSLYSGNALRKYTYKFPQPALRRPSDPRSASSSWLSPC